MNSMFSRTNLSVTKQNVEECQSAASFDDFTIRIARVAERLMLSFAGAKNCRQDVKSFLELVIPIWKDKLQKFVEAKADVPHDVLAEHPERFNLCRDLASFTCKAMDLLAEFIGARCMDRGKFVSFFFPSFSPTCTSLVSFKLIRLLFCQICCH